MKHSVGIRFGALADSIAEQLRAQELSASKDLTDQWQQLADSITRLYLGGLIPDGQARKARQKLLNVIAKSVRKTNGST